MIDIQYPNVMIDLETMGTRPGSVILSIGAVEFDATGTGDRFYIVVNKKSCLDAGLVVDPDTLDWWSRQSDDARLVLMQAADNSDTHPPNAKLAYALNQLAMFVERRLVWSNGADFDLPILSEAYYRCGFGKPPWSYRSPRCYRTLRALRESVLFSFKPTGVAHNAGDDAYNQAEHASRLLAAVGEKVP